MIIELERDNFFMLNWLNDYLVGHKGFICGGCFKNIFNKEKVKDLDIFFKSEEDWNSAVQYFDERSVGYVSPFSGEPLSEKEAEFRFSYKNEKVKAYIHLKSGVAIELCKSIFGEPKDIIKSFDFTITKFAYYMEEVKDEETDEIHIESKIICDDKFLEHLHLKRLVLDDKIPFPMSTLERAFRYSKYGYNLCKESKIKLAKAIRDLSEEQIEISKSLYNGMD